MPPAQHHYVPRFLLKNFAHGKNPQIYVYDKSDDRSFRTNIRNVAAERGFYDLESGDSVLTIEPSLAHLEANSSRVLKKVLRQRTLRCLDADGVAILAAFVAVQFVRTKEHRLRFEHLSELFAERLREMGTTEANIEELVKGPPDPREEKLFGFRAVVGVKDIIPHFLNKAWVLFETNRKSPFFISDNPATLHNEIDHSPYGNIGLTVRGIEIYFPLSTTVCLGLLCPSIAVEFEKAKRNLKLLDEVTPGLADKSMNNPAAARAFCEGLATGTPIQIVEDNVTMMNSLQVAYSTRFVYCETDTFALVERMIRDNEKYRNALRPTIS